MTSPEGERRYGWWKITTVDEPHSLAFDDGFAAHDSFTPAEDSPVSRNVYAFEAIDGGTRATFTTTFESAEALKRALEIGVIDGTASAIGQIDSLVTRRVRKVSSTGPRTAPLGRRKDQRP